MDQNFSPEQLLEESPLVSVIIPAYNAERFIAQTLESVLAQTYQNSEVLVVDDGSQDGTAAIVRHYMQRDDRIRLLQQPNAGVAAARNLGIEKSKGEFIAPLDADDIWFPDNIAKQVQKIQARGASVGLVYSWSVDIDESGNPSGGFKAAQIEGEVFTTLIAHNFIGNASATMMRRSCLEKIGGYNCSLKAQNAQGCEDWDIALRIAENYEFRAVPDFLIGYRKVGSTMSCDYQTMAKSHALMLTAVYARYPTLPKYLFKLANSNLYMYFAYESNRYRRHETTRFWLRQALTAEKFTPFIRLGFYRLLINSAYGSFASQYSAFYAAKKFTYKTSNGNIKNREKGSLELINFRVLLSLKIIVGNIFHKLITVLFKPSKNEKNHIKLPIKMKNL